MPPRGQKLAAVSNPLANYACNDDMLLQGRVRLKEVANALHQDWDYIVKENEQFVRGLRDGGKNLDEVTWVL